ncbi:hypothetical protein HPULCUR_010398 [Helicostylum pulchrum]|uniref:SEC7 domain-containing protein n=1 Tax=Helicostylum pulchrum TaxID=562976 RepID=A0ABP9YD49_9FUNG
MPNSSNTRRRSVSVSGTPYLSQSDTTTSSSIWNSNKSYFLSRFKNSPTTPPITPSTSTSTSIISSTTSNILPPIHGQQKVKRKPIVAASINSRKKYEAVLGIKTEDIISEDISRKKANANNRSFGKLFKKKRSKSVDKKLNAEQQFASLFRQPEQRGPIHAEQTKVPTPPLQNYRPQYHHYEVGEQPSLASKSVTSASNHTRWSNASTRKSTGSYSIYSTFGPESVYDGSESVENVTAATSVSDINETVEKEPVVLDLASIVATNVQTRNQARLITTVEYEEDEEDDEDEDDDEDDYEEEEEEDDNDQVGDIRRDIFVDATGVSQEDIERERIENRLSKRLSGGHFGSAGGLMMSMMDSPNKKRASRPPPEDVVQSMMNWKRHSGQMLDKVVTENAPPVPEKDTVSQDSYHPQVVPPERPLPPHPQILLSQDNEEQDEPKECAAKLWHEDEKFVQRERIAEWLGQSKPLNTSTLQAYMEYFDFTSMRLDGAFRKVCSKLYFRAEAQQIDRILEAFAKRYWQCNPKTIFGSADTVYAVVYSLLLLNTDLHVAQGSYTRMTRQAFVKNTMSTIKDQQLAKRTPNSMLAWEAHIEAYLKDMYISVKNYQILQPLQNQQELNNEFLSPTATTSSKRMSMMGGRRMTDIKRSLNTMIHKTSGARESMLFLDEPLPRKSTSSSNKHQMTTHRNARRESFSSTNSGQSSGLLTPRNTTLSPNQSHMMSFMDTHASDLFTSRPPYLKEGVVMRKHLLESANQKAKHREWKECLLVVGQGELKMYGLQSDGNESSRKSNMIRASNTSFANLADSLTKSYASATNLNSPLSEVPPNNGRWATYSQLIGSIELNHSLANSLPPPGYNRTRPFVFAIQEPNGGVYLIQAASQEQIIEWVSTCNYWAARLSKEPLQGGVSNIEYGWGSCLEDVILDLDAVESGKKITGKYFRDPDAVHISSWVPPTPTMVSSALDETTHYDNLQKYLGMLNQEINDHREIKKKILVKFPQKCQNHTRALSNWEAKSKYMLHDIIKYQNYCDVLEKSILKHRQEEEDSSDGEDS